MVSAQYQKALSHGCNGMVVSVGAHFSRAAILTQAMRAEAMAGK
jgi:hypothetical protein